MSNTVIGVIGSPNTTSEFHVDIVDESINSPLEGKLFCFNQVEGGRTKLVLGQMVSLQSRNRWHEDIVLKSVIRKQGALEHLSGVTDVKEGVLNLIGTFEKIDGTWKRSTLNTPPASGTPVNELSAALSKELCASEPGVFYLGNVYGSDTPAPFYLRHFGPEKSGGFGEAHTIGIFGKSGSGKSIIAAQMLLGLARHPELGMLILDPQGEFYDDRFATDSNYSFHFHELLRATRTSFHLIDIRNVALKGRHTFARLLQRVKWFKELGFGTSEKEAQAREALVSYMEDEELSPDRVDIDAAVNHLVSSAVQWIYAGKSNNKQQEIQSKYSNYRDRFKRIWDQVQGLFDSTGKTPLDGIIDKVLTQRELVILDVDKIGQEFRSRGLNAQELKYVLINEILRRMLYRVRVLFREGERSNCLVVLDEAHYYAPQDPGEDDDRVELLKQIQEAVRTTRKYGIGWMFITQSIADFNKEIYRQVHDHVFAWGLGIGADEKHVREIVGDAMFDVYKTLPNPKQSGLYTFMISGSIVALGTRGTPIIISGFSSEEDFAAVNELSFSKRSG